MKVKTLVDYQVDFPLRSAPAILKAGTVLMVEEYVARIGYSDFTYKDTLTCYVVGGSERPWELPPDFVAHFCERIEE